MNVESTSSLAHSSIWKEYVTLTKPGILRSNLYTTLGGFWLASQGEVWLHWRLLIFVLIGTTLVMASACVFNNYLDREHDKYMSRTKQRGLVTGRLQPKQVVWFGLILGVIGLLVLGAGINFLSFILGLIGMVVYIFIYTLWLKRTSTHSTLMGSFSGAVPPVIGYCAVTNSMDAAAWILFLILFIWQPPHFFALGIRRVEEYRAANFPLLPVVKGVWITKVQMVIYTVILIPCTYLLYHFGYVGEIYLVIAMLLGLIWLALDIYGFYVKDDEKWARNTFLFSIFYLVILFLFIMIDTEQRLT